MPLQYLSACPMYRSRRQFQSFAYMFCLYHIFLLIVFELILVLFCNAKYLNQYQAKYQNSYFSLVLTSINTLYADFKILSTIKMFLNANKLFALLSGKWYNANNLFAYVIKMSAFKRCINEKKMLFCGAQ